MAMFPFESRKSMLVFTCTHVLEQGSPILLVTHNGDDCNWEFLCGGTNHSDSDAVIVSLDEILAMDSSIEDLCDMELNCFAMRSAPGEKWYVRKVPDMQ